jgi:integrase
LLLLGFAGAFRRSELVALDVADTEETQTGLLVTIRRSKTDQEALGRTIAITRGDAACPLRLSESGWTLLGSCLDRCSDRSTSQARWRPRGLRTDRLPTSSRSMPAAPVFDPAIFSAHSLRSGFLTSAAAKGASIFKMMDQSGHKSIDTLRGYVRDAELFKDHAGAGLL